MTIQNGCAENAVTEVLQSLSGPCREVVVETPIAISFNGTTAAVMMGTPSDVRDLAIGFALTEGYLCDLSEIESYEELQHDNGLEARFWVTSERSDAIAARRRSMAGPVGCGLCGLESLEEAVRPAKTLTSSLRLDPAEMTQAMSDLYEWQPLKQRTRSTHAAGFYRPGEGIVAVREDVGRHNAFDKLIGHLTQNRHAGHEGAVFVTSRLSLEMIQKCASLGSPTLVAASGPTSLAIQTARACGISLIGFCRRGEYEVFC